MIRLELLEMNTSKYRLNAADDKTIPKERTAEVVAQPLLWYEIWLMRFCGNMKILTKRTKPRVEDTTMNKSDRHLCSLTFKNAVHFVPIIDIMKQ